MSIQPGMTARAPFVVDDGGRKTALVDKHVVILAVENGQAYCVYTGTDDGEHLRRLPGYISIPSQANAEAGWKLSGRFYADASKVCRIPSGLLEVEGRVGTKLFAQLSDKVAKVCRGMTEYDASIEERRTGHVRQMKSGAFVRR